MINIQNLRNMNNFAKLYALIQTAERKYTTDNKQYLDITLQDMTGVINAKLWNASDEAVTTFTSGSIVEVSGDITIYRKEPQVRIKDIELYDGMDVEYFVASAPIERSKLQELIYNYILQIENPTINTIVLELVKKYEDDFFVYPAASKNHHAYVNGLAHHVYGMLELAEFICSKHSFLNRDLLYAGVILHDFGKVIELSGPVSTEYTTIGNLVGHITIATNEVAILAKEQGIEDQEEVMLIQHLILSHHGKLEFGSPKLPLIAEAEILNYIDNVDSRLNMLEKTLNNTDEKEFSSRVFSLENRKFYKHQ